MSDNNRRFMEMTLEIAYSRLGKTSPNPSVGAVIVKDDKIVSTGGTSSYGADHAEVVAIKNAKANLKGAEIYISLEPCCHYSKTPPCTDAIIDSGISRVYLPICDPNPAVQGRGVQKLRDAGVDVIIMEYMADKAYDLIRQFRKYIQKKKPYVIHKSAVTLDGRIATEAGDSKWVSSEYSRYLVHKLRSISDAIIIGKNTLVNDNPTLNVRLDAFPEEVREFFRNANIPISGKGSFFLQMLINSKEPEETGYPLRVILGIPEEIDFTKNIFYDDNYLFFVEENRRSVLVGRGSKELDTMIESGKIVFINGESREQQIEEILSELYNRGKMLVMLEGGGTIAGKFFEAGEIDQCCYFLAPKLVGSGIGPLEGAGKSMMQDSLKLYDVSTVMINEDVLYNAYSESIMNDKGE